MSKMDKLHPETNLAKIRRGDTSILKEPEFLAPLPHDPLQELREQNNNFNLDSGLLSAWWEDSRIQHIEAIVAARVRISASINTLQEHRSKAAAHELLHEAKVQVEYALAQNQMEVLRQATALGVPVAEYAQYTLFRFQKQLEIEAQELKMKSDVRLERFNLEETYRAVLTKARLQFEHQRQLIDEIAELRTAMTKVDFENLAPSAKRIKKQQLKNLISSKELELASQQEALSTGDRTRLGRVIKGTPQLEGPEE
jgi:hypothetical protein